MKAVYVLIGVLLSTIKVFAQDTLKFEQLANKDFYKNVKNYQEFKVYIDEKGNKYEAGTKLRLGRPENPNNVYDDIIKGRRTGNFTFIRRVKGMVMTLEKIFSNEEVTITNIVAFHTGAFRGTPLEPQFECKLKNKIELQEFVYIDNIDKAMNLGEVINPNMPPDKEQAIKLLEEKKKLLDLGVISNEEYEKFKKQYAEIILKSGN